jgi:hypothetical protein
MYRPFLEQRMTRDTFSPAQGATVIARKKYRFWWSVQGPIAFAETLERDRDRRVR